MFVIVDHVREMTVKKSCKHGEYGSVEHLHFLLVIIILHAHVASSELQLVLGLLFIQPLLCVSV